MKKGKRKGRKKERKKENSFFVIYKRGGNYHFRLDKRFIRSCSRKAFNRLRENFSIWKDFYIILSFFFYVKVKVSTNSKFLLFYFYNVSILRFFLEQIQCIDGLLI